ncbi:hypothetical protein EDB97_10810 [Agrobacterium tumefaciens]|nr:hypothetical protein EDB97_10810 [Agrobacterium tumefaciens]
MSLIDRRIYFLHCHNSKIESFKIVMISNARKTTIRQSKKMRPTAALIAANGITAKANGILSHITGFFAQFPQHRFNSIFPGLQMASRKSHRIASGTMLILPQSQNTTVCENGHGNRKIR